MATVEVSERRLLPRVAAACAVTVLYALPVLAAGPALRAQHLEFVEGYFDGVGGIDGLGGAVDVVVSPDGRHVYVAGAFDSALAVFARDPVSGVLTFVEAVFDNAGGVTGLDGVMGMQTPSAVAVSPEGRHLYVAAFFGSSLAVFRGAGIFSDGFESGDLSGWSSSVP